MRYLNIGTDGAILSFKTVDILLYCKHLYFNWMTQITLLVLVKGLFKTKSKTDNHIVYKDEQDSYIYHITENILFFV